MYRKRKKIINSAIDIRLESIISDFFVYNEDTVFLISKSYIERPDGTLGDEIEQVPFIITSTPIEELNIPSSYKINKNWYLSNWCDSNYLIKLIHSNFHYSDGQINGKTYNDLYLELDNQDKIDSIKIKK